MDENYRRLNYVRYADDFLIAVIGSKEDAIKIKKDLTVFLRENLNLELSEEKTLITNTKKKARFLGYDIRISRSSARKKDKNGFMKRTTHLKVQLLVPYEVWRNNLLTKRAMKIKNGHIWKPVHRPYLRNLDDLEIINIYNAEIRGLYNYYRLALNVCVINKYKYIMEYSMYKTYANKYNSSISKIIAKNNVNGKFAIRYKTKNGTNIRFFYNDGFRRQTRTTKFPDVDKLPQMQKYMGRTSLIKRLQATKCEWCGESKSKIEIHHVRKLKDLKGKKAWERAMIERKRKTMALCITCHDDLHAGRLD
ncbi:hypothetical protein J4P90_13215 [Bacillus sp. SY8(2021)]|uniref:Reverse transcriptase domain-containing protein n=1 Tax=Bacillus arachidis TaxID=2819290 RepID=A0ABS3NZ09_9BACI|nr:hypothetical protein [Bacillus arachidis]